MKSKNLFSAFAVILTAAVLTSCSTSIDIVKRQFNDGYYVSISKKKPSAKAPEQPAVATEENTPSQTAQAPVAAEQEFVQEEKISVAQKETASPAPAPAKNRNNKKVRLETSSDPEVMSDEPRAEQAENNTPSFSLPSSLSGGSVPTIIMILLCLFLPFIAVGIVDDWRTRFLISILLTLLFWIPGVIYAFIVCFS